jgi:ABC transport system ATP-binding/permease protein
VIWIMTLVLYVTLYFELLKKLVDSFGNMPGKVNLPKVGLPKKK